MKAQIKHALLFWAAFVSFTANAQAPAIQWNSAYGGSKMDYFNCTRQIKDGGYVASGDGESADGDMLGDTNHGIQDGWIVVLNSNGTIRHQRAFGGSDGDQLPCVLQTYDGGYVACGPSASSNGDVPPTRGNNDYWIIKTDSLLNIKWSKTYGGTGDDWAYIVIQTKDSGFAISGRSNSNNDNVTSNHGNFDFWVIKLDKNGNLQWEKSIGGSGTDDFASGLAQTSDGGYIVCGRTNSSDGDFANDTAHGGYDAALVKLDANGNIKWSRTYGGTGDEVPRSVIQTADGGYVFCASTLSNNKDVSGNHGRNDFWTVKTDSLGNMQWQRTDGGSKDEFPLCVAASNDGGYLVCGRTFSYDGEVTGHHPAAATQFDSGDCWVIKINGANPNGPLVWEKCLGGSHYDGANWIEQTSDNGYIVGAEAYSADGDVSNFHNPTTFEDGWVVKLGPDPMAVNEVDAGIKTFSVYPNPSNGIFNADIKTEGEISAYDIAGRKIYETKVVPGQVKLDLGSFAEGVYFLRDESREGAFTQKIMLVK